MSPIVSLRNLFETVDKVFNVPLTIVLRGFELRDMCRGIGLTASLSSTSTRRSPPRSKLLACLLGMIIYDYCVRYVTVLPVVAFKTT